MRKYLFTIISCTIFFSVSAQEKWDLRRCVDYAIKNNISVKQTDVQARLSALQLKQQQLNLYPTVGFSTNLTPLFGRSINPTTNLYTTSQLLAQNYTLQGNVTLYNWGKLRHSVESQKLNTQGAYIDIEKAANDVSLNVVNAYLLVLSSQAQVVVNQVQVKQTQEQLDITRKQLAAGIIPELNVIQMEAKLSSDSSNLITAQANYDINMLALKATLNLDMATPFEVESPNVEKIPVESFGDLQPDVVYRMALGTQPQQKSFKIKIKGAIENIKASKAALYPSIGAGYVLVSNFANYLKEIDPNSATPAGNVPTSNFVNVGGINYSVMTPIYNYAYTQKSFGNWWKGYGSQINNNFTQRLFFGITVPIFSNGQNRIAYENSKLNLQNIQLQSDLADVTLKQNVYTAYSNAVGSFQKLNASKKNVESMQKAYDVAVKRYEIGLLGILDLITNQNNLTTAKLNVIANEYDYIFKMKLLEFYKGLGIKL